MVCPQEELVFTPFQGISCELPIVFRPNTYSLSDIPYLGNENRI